MKTKTMTKTFYVNDIYLEAIKSDLDRSIVIRKKDETGLDMLTYPATNKIQISWQEPEKKIEISESQADEIFHELKWDLNSLDVLILKQKLFGKK